MSLNAHLFGILFPTAVSYATAVSESGIIFGQSVTDEQRHIDLTVNGIYRLQDMRQGQRIGRPGIPPHSAENARLVALSDNQLVFLLLRKTERQ